jgi:aspartate carbamoyltransferase catalytic subunit
VRHLLAAEGLDADRVTNILDTADHLKQTLLGREVRQ